MARGTPSEGFSSGMVNEGEEVGILATTIPVLNMAIAP